MKTSTEYAFDYWGVKRLQEDAAKGEALPSVDESMIRQVWEVFPAPKGQVLVPVRFPYSKL